MDLNIFWRMLVSFLAIWLGIRLLGKKEMGKLTYYNLATSAAIGSLAANLAIDKSMSALIPLTALFIFFLMSFIFGQISLHSYSGRKLLEGEPTLVVSKGEILEDNLRKMRITTDNLMEKLREKNAFNVADVEFAVMEVDGKLSTLLKSESQPVTPKTMYLKVPSITNLPTDVIKDGNFVEENLVKLGLSKNWLETQLQNKNVQDINDVGLAQIDSSGQLYIDLKKDRLTAKTTLS